MPRRSAFKRAAAATIGAVCFASAVFGGFDVTGHVSPAAAQVVRPVTPHPVTPAPAPPPQQHLTPSVTPSTTPTPAPTLTPSVTPSPTPTLQQSDQTQPVQVAPPPPPPDPPPPSDWGDANEDTSDEATADGATAQSSGDGAQPWEEPTAPEQTNREENGWPLWLAGLALVAGFVFLNSRRR